MKAFSSMKLLLLLGVFVVLFSSCQDDETIYDHIIGRTWVGDLGFSVDSYPVESGITFKGDDYAIDEQWFYDGGGRAATLDIRWWIDMGTLYLDYGSRYPMLEIRNVWVGGHDMDGDLYVNGIYEGEITLEMQD